MYEAPDRYKRLISARLPGGNRRASRRARSNRESSPLRDVQLISRAQLAPFFAAANIVAALMMVANLWGDVAPSWLLPWVLRGRRRQSRRDAARPHPVDHLRRPLGPPRAELAAGRRSRRPRRRLAQPAALLCSRRSIPGTQVIAASIMAGLGIGALGLVVIPPCATAWMVAFTGGVGGVAADRPPHRSVPAHAVDPVHARRRRSSAC